MPDAIAQAISYDNKLRGYPKLGDVQAARPVVNINVSIERHVTGEQRIITFEMR